MAVSEVDQSASLAVGQARLSNRLGLQWREAPAQGGAVGAQSFTALGQFGAGVDTHGWRLRGTLDYRLAPAVQPLVAALSVARGRSRFSWSMDLGYDMAAHKALLGLGASTRLGPLDLGVQGSVSGGLWRIGLTSRFSLYHAPVGGYRLGLAGMSNTASLLPEVAMADNAAPIADTRFIVDNSLRPEETDAAGVARISGLSAGRPITIAPQASSLPDDRLRPVEKGATIRLRPGQVTPLTFHVAPTGEIEARIVSRNGDAVTPLPGEVVELLAADGTARKAMSDFDGFAYYDGVAYGTYTLRCANCAAASLDLTVDEGHSFVSGKVLTVVPPGAATP